MDAVRRGIRGDEVVERPVDNPTEPATVTGVWEYRCRLCRLTKSHPRLIELIHARHFKDRKPYSVIMEEVNRLIDDQALDIKPIKHSAFTAHFNQHVPADAAFLHQVQADRRERAKSREPQDDSVLQHVLAFKRDNIEALQQNLARWQKIADHSFGLIPIDQDPNEPIASPLAVKAAFNQFAIATQSITSITSTLDRYVNGKDFVVAVLKEGIDHFTAKLSLVLGAAVRTIEEEAGSQTFKTPAEMATWMHARLSEAVAEQINNLRAESQQIVTDRYRLKGAA